MSIEKTIFFSIVTFLLLLPFFFISGIFNPYEYPKFIFVVITTQMLASLFFLTKLYRNESLTLSISPLLWSILGYLCIVFTADMLGMDPKISLLGSMYRYQGFLLLVCSCELLVLMLYCRKVVPNAFLLFALTLFLSTSGLCLVTLFQAVQVFVYHDGTVPLFYGRFIATMGNPNFLGGYLAAAFPFVILTLWSWSKKRVWKIGMCLYSLIVVCTILLTDSKSALLSLIIIALFYFFTQLSLRGVKRRGNLKLLIPACPSKLQRSGVVLLISLILFFFHAIRFSPWDNRLIIWFYGLQSVSEHPILGIGQENYALIVDPARHIPIDNAHNIFFEVTVASGLLGLLFFLSILYYAFKQASLPIRLSLMALLITALFNPLSIPQIILFWLLISLTISLKKNNDLLSYPRPLP